MPMHIRPSKGTIPQCSAISRTMRQHIEHSALCNVLYTVILWT